MSASLIGTTLDRYRIESVLGEGGFGAVYRARHTMMDRVVALKVMREDAPPTSVQRFLREARAATAIGSEHIARVDDCGVVDGRPFLAMELLDGEDLQQRLERVGTLPLEAALEIAIQALEGLGAAHDAGIVHRDLKPGNIFLTRTPIGERVKLLDFGISKIPRDLSKESIRLTKTGTVLGTPYYMAPEQFRSAHAVDARADLYALGVVLYQMVSGAFPFDAPSYEALVIKVVSEPLLPLLDVAPDLPFPFARVVERALARDPDARWPTARALQSALRAVFELGHGGDDAPIHTQPLPVTPPVTSEPPPAASPAPVEPATEPSLPPMMSTTPSHRSARPRQVDGHAATQLAPEARPSARPSAASSHASREPRAPLGWLGFAAVLFVVAAGAVGWALTSRSNTAASTTPNVQYRAAVPTLVGEATEPIAPEPIAPITPMVNAAETSNMAPTVQTAGTDMERSAPPRGSRIEIAEVGNSSGPVLHALLGRTRAGIDRCRQARPATVNLQVQLDREGRAASAGPDPRFPHSDSEAARCAGAAIAAADAQTAGNADETMWFALYLPPLD